MMMIVNAPVSSSASVFPHPSPLSHQSHSYHHHHEHQTPSSSSGADTNNNNRSGSRLGAGVTAAVTVSTSANSPCGSDQRPLHPRYPFWAECSAQPPYPEQHQIPHSSTWQQQALYHQFAPGAPPAAVASHNLHHAQQRQPGPAVYHPQPPPPPPTPQPHLSVHTPASLPQSVERSVQHHYYQRACLLFLFHLLPHPATTHTVLTLFFHSWLARRVASKLPSDPVASLIWPSSSPQTAHRTHRAL